MEILNTVRWRGDIPGYGAVSRAGYAVSVPNERTIACSFRAPLVNLPEPANWVELSDAGQLVWQGHDTDTLYRDRTPLDVRGFGQHSFMFVGEELRVLTSVEEYQATRGGWAYVNDAGALVPYGDVYSGPPLWGRTEFHDVWIGQGSESGVCVWSPDDTLVRLLEDGAYRDVRVRRTGDVFLILAVNYPQWYTRIWRATLHDLRTLPLVVVAPPSDPGPTPDPIPIPEPTMDDKVLDKTAYDIYAAVAAKFIDMHKSPDDDVRREANKRSVATVRARLGSAGARYVCKSQHNTGWAAQSKDTLAEVVNVADAVEGREVPMWMYDMINGGSRQVNGYPIQSENFTRVPPNPKAFVLIPESKDWLAGEVPPDTPPPADSDLAKQIAAVRSQMEHLAESSARTQADMASLRAEIAEVKTRVEDLAARPGGYSGPFVGTVKGRTKPAGTWIASHSHEFEFDIIVNKPQE